MKNIVKIAFQIVTNVDYEKLEQQLKEINKEVSLKSRFRNEPIDDIFNMQYLSEQSKKQLQEKNILEKFEILQAKVEVFLKKIQPIKKRLSEELQDKYEIKDYFQGKDKILSEVCPVCGAKLKLIVDNDESNDLACIFIECSKNSEHFGGHDDDLYITGDYHELAGDYDN